MVRKAARRAWKSNLGLLDGRSCFLIRNRLVKVNVETKSMGGSDGWAETLKALKSSRCLGSPANVVEHRGFCLFCKLYSVVFPTAVSKC